MKIEITHGRLIEFYPGLSYDGHFLLSIPEKGIRNTPLIFTYLKDGDSAADRLHIKVYMGDSTAVENLLAAATIGMSEQDQVEFESKQAVEILVVLWIKYMVERYFALMLQQHREKNKITELQQTQHIKFMNAEDNFLEEHETLWRTLGGAQNDRLVN